MNNYPLVTIAIPTYNRAETYLRFTLESALKQTYPNIEIIVADNCSTDNTEELVKSYKDNRIRYYRHDKNIGANNNFNFCLQQARGKYFQLLQDDDLIDEDFIETCIKELSNDKNTGVIFTGTRIIDSDGNIISEVPNLVKGLSTEEFFLGWFLNKISPYLCSTLFNTERLREIGGFRSKHNLFQDAIAEFQLAAKFGRIDIRDIKASFRKHDGEMTFAAKVSQWCEDSLLLLDLMSNLASDLKDKIRGEGMKFFARLNYNRAKAVKSPILRLIAYLTVFKKFDYRHFPSKDHFWYFIYTIVDGTPLYSAIRFIKRKVKIIANS